MPLVSVIVAHFGCEDYLAEAVRSILDQCCRDLEVIVIDDASPDMRWRAALDGFTGDPRLRLYRSPVNVGNYVLKSQALWLCDSRYLAFQDADDQSCPQRLQRQIDILELGGIDVLGTGFLTIDATGAPIAERMLPRLAGPAVRLGKSFAMLHPTAMMPTRFFAAIGGFGAEFRIAGDHDFLLRATLAGRARNLQEILYRYRIRPGSLTTALTTGHGSSLRTSVRKSIARRDLRRVLTWPLHGRAVARVVPTRILLEPVR